jgi:site-specific recombinase XerD
MNLIDLHQRFLRYCAIEEGLSQNTLNDLKSKISTFFKRTEVNEINDINANMVKSFFYEGIEIYQWSFYTYDNYHKYLKKFFQWAVNEGHMKENYILHIKKPKRPQRLPRRLTEAQINKIMVATFSMPYQYHFEYVRNQAIIATYIYTGLRRSELLKLRITDLNMEDMTIFISQGKGKKDRYVPIHYKLRPILKRYFAERKKANKESLYLFVGLRSNKPLSETGIKKICRKVRKAAGVHFTPHQLRHSFASQAVEQGINLVVLKEIMGHSDIRTTMIYLKMSPKSLGEGMNSVELF